MFAAPLLAEEGASGASGLGALGVDPWSLLVYLVNFAALLLVLYFFAYKRVIGMLDERSNRIRESLEEADRVRHEAEQRQADMEKTLAENRQESQRILTQAQQMAERYRQEQAEQARAEAEAMMTRAREEIRHERDAALESVRKEFGTLAVAAAERIVRRSIDADAHRDLIEEVLAESAGMHSQGRG